MSTGLLFVGFLLALFAGFMVLTLPAIGIAVGSYLKHKRAARKGIE